MLVLQFGQLAQGDEFLLTPGSLDPKVQEEARGLDHCIARLATARTAFVGRTLRGPVNRPRLIKSFAEFQQAFGGLWQPSLLGYAVEQFFDNGGCEALIVRVVNGARAATLTLKAGDGTLRLRATRPGTREYLRASVDYDNLSSGSADEFNLTVQRVRAQGTGQVDDQEIFRALSLAPESAAYFPYAISESQLIELDCHLPAQRPDRTLDPASGLATGYVNSNADGDDGGALTDYDLIGSELESTGIFSLNLAQDFNFLCIPPLTRDRDIGPSALLVGARYCKEKRALLIVDPPSGWHTADDALRGMRDWSFSSENALMYFPRILAHDKLRGHFETFAPCGAVAGMLARGDGAFPVWGSARQEDSILRPGYRPSCLVTEERRMKLALLGVNTIQAVRSAARIGVTLRTLAAGAARSADWQHLSSRRLALFIVNSIERGTRWTATAENHAGVDELAVTEVRKFLETIHEAGAFGALKPEDAFFVAHEVSLEPQAPLSTFQFVIGFAALRGPGFHTFRITHSALGHQAVPFSVNRATLARYSPAELDWVERLANQLES